MRDLHAGQRQRLRSLGTHWIRLVRRTGTCQYGLGVENGGAGCVFIRKFARLIVAGGDEYQDGRKGETVRQIRRSGMAERAARALPKRTQHNILSMGQCRLNAFATFSAGRSVNGGLLSFVGASIVLASFLPPSCES